METRDPAPVLRDPAHQLSPRARTMWLLGSASEAVFTFAVLFVVLRFWDPFDVPWWAWLLVAVGSAAYAGIVPVWRYAVHRWEVTETAVYTQTGWWVRERRIAPMSRLQTVDYGQGPIERLFGLATVTVTTASAAGALRISGLERTVAERLVAELTQQADAVAGDAT